ncbi:hypothetical protein F4859DRAFT_449923 [Xylaria cf. heliscus]|nr:hypothetical protein F4859DRAFT_449923 [Xylaria cf. heliscus]
MSLGISSLWGARSRIRLVQGLSLVPRGSQNLLFASRIQGRYWLSSSAGPPSREPPSPERPSPEWPSLEGAAKPPDFWELFEEAAETDEADKADKADKAPRRKSNRTPPHPHSIRAMVTEAQEPDPHAGVLIKRAISYPNPQASARSLQKHKLSVRTQVRYTQIRNAFGKYAHNWLTTLDLLIRHSPKFGEVIDFKVGIGREAAAGALANLSELDTNLWQIQQRHRCKIHVESGFHDDKPLILSLSGTDVSVRESLLDIVSAVGQVTGVRVMDPTLEISSPEFWKSSSQGQLPIQLLGQEESASEGTILTVYGHNGRSMKPALYPAYEQYQLTMRADEIPRPVAWTKTSFENYVAQLVFAQVPTRLHKSLYPDGLDHQSTVVQLLTQLFTSEDTRSALSVAALKHALRYMQSRLIFREQSRILYNRAQLLHLPLDAEVFHIFLTNASKAGDLDTFNNFLRAMRRKGLYMRAETWIAFLGMIQDPQIKYYVMRKMRSHGLDRLQPVLKELGRENVLLVLERRADSEINMVDLLEAQDKQYGLSWLNNITLNKMIYILSARGNLRACHELLDLVSINQRVKPDQHTLNTMISNTRSIPEKIALLSRWPGLEPDVVTYHILMQVAWRKGLPNMLRVLWRYAEFAGLVSVHIRYTLTKLMRPEANPSKHMAYLKAWEDVIFGRSELAASRLLDSNPGPMTARLMLNYVKDAGDLRPIVPLGSKLGEAYDLDLTIRKLHKEGAEISPALRESLTVNMSLGSKVKDSKTKSSKTKGNNIK